MGHFRKKVYIPSSFTCQLMIWPNISKTYLTIERLIDLSI